MVSYNKMPDMLESMLKQEGMLLRQKDVLIGGQGLCGHSLDANVKELLHAEKWSYVVLQDHSSVPGGADETAYRIRWPPWILSMLPICLPRTQVLSCFAAPGGIGTALAKITDPSTPGTTS